MTNFVETVLLREKALFEESQRAISVQAEPGLLCQERHVLVRDADENNAEHAARSVLFEALLDHARQGSQPRS